MPSLTVEPKTVELKTGETQAFEARDEANKRVVDVTWSIVPPNAGVIDKTGVYSSPASLMF